jgi:aspartate ammonia-lyase
MIFISLSNSFLTIQRKIIIYLKMNQKICHSLLILSVAFISYINCSDGAKDKENVYDSPMNDFIIVSGNWKLLDKHQQ